MTEIRYFLVRLRLLLGCLSSISILLLRMMIDSFCNLIGEMSAIFLEGLLKTLISVRIMRKNKFKKFLDFRGGMQRDLGETRLRDNELYTLKNMRIEDDGTLMSRYGASKQNASAIAVGNGNMITQLRQADGTKRLLSQFVNDIYHYVDDAWTSIKSEITDAIMNVLQFSDKMIMGNAVNNVMSYGKETSYESTVHAYLANTASDKEGIGDRLQSNFSLVQEIRGMGSGINEFNNPEGICGSGDYLYIADSLNHRIVKRLAADLSYVASIGTQGTGDNQFDTPKGIDTDGTHIWIADTNNHRIKKHLCSDLSYVSKIGSQGTGNDQFDSPEDICFSTVGGTDFIYVADTANDRIHKRLASNLNLSVVVGSTGTGNDQFDGPVGIESDTTNVYVCDTNNDRIHKRLATNLNYVAIQGTGGNRAPLKGTIYGTDLYVVLAGAVIRKYALSNLAESSVTSVVGYLTDIEILTIATSSDEYTVRDIGTPNAPKVTVGSATGLTGTYKYKLTWETGTLKGSGGPESNSITVTNQKIAISEVESPSWLQALTIAKIRRYRTKAGGSVYYYVDEIDADGTFAEDSTADGSIGYDPDGNNDGTDIIPSQSLYVPQMKYFAEYQGHIFGAGYGTNPSFLYFSALYSDDDWYDNSSGTLRFIRVYENDGDEIKGLREYYGQLFIFKRDSVHRLTGVYPSYNIARIKSGDGAGTISHRTIQEYERKLFWLSEKGIEMMAGYEPKTITDLKIQSIIRTINKEQEELSFAFIYQDKYYLFIPTGSNTYCDTCIVYDLHLNCFYYDTGINGISGQTVEDADDYEIPYIADNAGFVWQYEDITQRADGTSAIDCEIKTGKITLQEDYEQAFRELQTENYGNGTLNYAVQVEGRTVENYTKTLTGNYLNFRYTPSAQWGKSIQLTITQNNADDYFFHRSHTLWYKIKGTDKEG